MPRSVKRCELALDNHDNEGKAGLSARIHYDEYGAASLQIDGCGAVSFEVRER
jgi:hypothetical protein